MTSTLSAYAEKFQHQVFKKMFTTHTMNNNFFEHFLNPSNQLLGLCVRSHFSMPLEILGSELEGVRMVTYTNL